MNPDVSNYYNSRAELKRILGDEYGALKIIIQQSKNARMYIHLQIVETILW